MPKPHRAESLSIDGPAGRIETIFEQPAGDDAGGVAVVCHPHPMHGGSMENKVAHTLARAFLASGFASLRFNFRGVGESEGEFDEGRGEVDDVLAVVAAARERKPGQPLWLAGFSFGAGMAIRAATRAGACGLVSVAPAAARFVDDFGEQPRCPWLIVHGEDDDVVPIEETIDWMNALEPGPEFAAFAETGHFFHGKLVALRKTVADFVIGNSRR